MQKDFAGNVQHSERSGILLAAAGFSSLSVGDAIVKTMAGEWSPLAVAALRFTIGAIALSLLLLRSEGPGAFRPRRPLLQVARGACLAGATLCFFSAVFVMQLAEAMALAFVSPVFVALLSGPLLKEKVRPAVWIASPSRMPSRRLPPGESNVTANRGPVIRGATVVVKRLASPLRISPVAWIVSPSTRKSMATAGAGSRPSMRAAKRVFIGQTAGR